MKKRNILQVLAISFLMTVPLNAQRRKAPVQEKISLDAFEFRNIGPAFLSGRIADIAIDPNDENRWFVAVGSGGVWKTENSGTTWKPLFDEQSSYSTGCVTIDPTNSNVIWVGTGENVGGRHVAYGDGIYKSEDGGESWKNMGLKSSEHISKIVVHPTNPDIVWVASQGPLWNKGGERGVYKTTDGGISWKRVLGNAEWTGATELVIDPRDPDVLYAATWDRHRTVAALMGGGPGSGLHRSIDGGETWTKLSKGLPTSNLGKIGLAISPQQPDVIYAAIELDRKSGAVYRSADRGASWVKMSNTVSGGTGPHYYQELYASPHQFDRLYLMNVRVLTSEDGGKTFTELKEEKKHSDNHAIAFKKDDPNYLMIGTDAGIYESFDLAENWRYIKNLPLTQFYKVAVNNAEPFYHVFGGTQDNGSAGGPSATDEVQGISNKHWYKTLFADGHQSATDPEYNDIIYAETQQGGLHRVDLTTGEPLAIQPQAFIGDPHERFNWDAPILVSPHDPARLYFASYRVWKSDSRGDDWTPISGDLTRNEERLNLPIMGRQQSWDNAWDVMAMSNYNTITSLSESPIKEGLLYAGTDDGFVQVTENGGTNWSAIPVTKMGVPERSFVNDIKADLHDENTVYVVLDNHKEGDFNPYVFKSTDKGKTWSSISANLPKRTLLWRIVQDHIDPNLLFIATEFGVYTSLNGGGNWQKLPGTPNMAFRDLTIQKRENDLVAASFGRGFYILDDYSALRQMNAKALSADAALFETRPAKWFVQRSNLGNTGADFYIAENPTYGAVFTYHLATEYKSSSDIRKEREKKANESNASIPFVGYDVLDQELLEPEATVWILIKDDDGNLIRKISDKAAKGTHRIAWDLRHAHPAPLVLDEDARVSESGPIVRPGMYSASLIVEKGGEVLTQTDAIRFEVKPIRKGVLQGVDHETYESFRANYAAVEASYLTFSQSLDQIEERIEVLKANSARIINYLDDLKTLNDLGIRLADLKKQTSVSPSRDEVGEKDAHTALSNLRMASRGFSTTYGPTPLHHRSLSQAKEMLLDDQNAVEELSSEVTEFVARLEEKGIHVIQ
jgi:photosystem II stability/assembly factor-like uncharacterized protein